MKRMKKIAIAEEKADHFRASFENAASLRVRTKSQTVNGIQYTCAGLPAYLRAGIQHAGDRTDADTRGTGNLANRRFCWNRFHLDCVFSDAARLCFRFGALTFDFSRGKLTTPLAQQWPVTSPAA